MIAKLKFKGELEIEYECLDDLNNKIEALTDKEIVDVLQIDVEDITPPSIDDDYEERRIEFERSTL